MWYVIQTTTGSEQELLTAMDKALDRRFYQRCFHMKREAVWRRSGKCVIHIESLFPGYVFIQTENPGEIYLQLKKIPQFSKLLGKEEIEFYPVSKEEELFLRQMLNGDIEDTVRLSAVRVDEQGNLQSCEGALRYFQEYIIKKRIRLRYVIIRVHLLGRDREVKLGIRLDEDE